MAIIRQLKNFFTKQVIYPKTLTKAVYDENGERLDKILRDTMLATDNEEYNGVVPRDADTLGGKYTKVDVENIIEENNELRKRLDELNSNLVWKELGIVSATQSLKLPSDFNELEIALRTNGTNHTGIIRVSKASLSWLQKGLISTCVWYQTSNDSVSYRIRIVDNSISLDAARIGVVDSRDTTSIRVLYR